MHTEAFPLRAHHLDFAFSMAVSLQQTGRKDIVLSDALAPLLTGETISSYEALTDDDLFFLGLLTNLSWLIRENFSQRKKSDLSYDHDLIGNDKDQHDLYIDQHVVAASSSILAVFLPNILIAIGDVLDGQCLACAEGKHCMSQKSNDLAILIQLQNFIKGVSAPTPSDYLLEMPRFDQVAVIDSGTIKDFLLDRTESILINLLDLTNTENAILVPGIFRVLLMTRKRSS